MTLGQKPGDFDSVLLAQSRPESVTKKKVRDA